MKISMNDYSIFCDEFFSETLKKYPTMRFGQSFWNKFLNHDTQLEDRLFYEPNTLAAQKIIFHNYLEV